MTKSHNTSTPRILTLDIETSPLNVYCWGLWEQNIGLEQIGAEWTILSFSAKWLDEKKIHYYCTGGRGPDKVRDDREVLQKLWEFLDEADIVVVQNGRAFDIKKINARLLLLGFKPYSPIKVIDTMAEAKKRFDFTSNKLAWLTEHLTDTPKSKHKLFPGFELWAECLKDNSKAWKEMEKYNCIDTLGAEKVYLVMRPWIEGHPNLATYLESEIVLCPKCGSDKIQKRGLSVTQTGKYHRYCCNNCGGWSRSRYTINTSTKRKTLLSN